MSSAGGLLLLQIFGRFVCGHLARLRLLLGFGEGALEKLDLVGANCEYIYNIYTIFGYTIGDI